MKRSSTILVILALILVAEHGAGESNSHPLTCCNNCVFTFSGLCHCDDVVKKCDKKCLNCTQVHAHPRTFKCQDTFIGTCGPKCKRHLLS